MPAVAVIAFVAEAVEAVAAVAAIAEAVEVVSVVTEIASLGEVAATISEVGTMFEGAAAIGDVVSGVEAAGEFAGSMANGVEGLTSVADAGEMAGSMTEAANNVTQGIPSSGSPGMPNGSPVSATYPPSASGMTEIAPDQSAIKIGDPSVSSPTPDASNVTNSGATSGNNITQATNSANNVTDTGAASNGATKFGSGDMQTSNGFFDSLKNSLTSDNGMKMVGNALQGMAQGKTDGAKLDFQKQQWNTMNSNANAIPTGVGLINQYAKVTQTPTYYSGTNPNLIAGGK